MGLKEKLEDLLKYDTKDANLLVCTCSTAISAASLLGLVVPRLIASLTNPSYNPPELKPYEYFLLKTAAATTVAALGSGIIYIYKSHKK